MFSNEFYHSPADSHVRHRPLNESVQQSWRLPSPASAPFVLDLAHLDDSAQLKSSDPPETTVASTLSGWFPGIPSPGSVFSSPRSQRSSISSVEGQSHLSSLHPNQFLARTPFPSELISRDCEPASSPSRLVQRSSPQAIAETSQTSDYQLLPQSMHPGSVAFLTTNMAHNSQNYSWQNRPPQPLHPTSMAMDQQSYPQAHALPPQHAYPAAYQPQHTSSQSYYQPGLPSSHYLSSQPGVPHSRHQPRSSSIPYPYPSASVSGSPPTIPDPSFTSTPPSYLVNQPDYYLTPNSSISQTPNSMPQPHALMPAGTVYSSPDSAPSSSDQDQQVRVISFRPKPQCWDHGCNGREFSTFSNLLRHQREKSGVVAKAECPSCGAVFTRTTARNIHVAQGKCKGIAREPSAE
ncbi:hypothetical protein BO94DRAFT_560975 [Aspergillus sclerotioniger CBS 115572]|uniref:C2H2-type domain-containing protein n=1 Tax=Aspergillus sclerotioniger CBS 115572 TaxID=1450535 RepID=A0A317V404_9EURO|nr:hypothetical protein BO94DRAFT_560975 [Aspergillus sclerotioniger CBS 115572]PWY68071.1 hypothetical protein BO94DRAFT_560975 [Aspergillus sclerotioniger CBS 115572]